MIIKTRIRPHMADAQRYKLHVDITLSGQGYFAHQDSSTSVPGYKRYKLHVVTTLKWPSPFSVATPAHRRSKLATWFRLALRKKRLPQGSLFVLVRPPGFEPRTLVPKTSVISISPWARCEEPILNAILRYRKPNDKAYDSR